MGRRKRRCDSHLYTGPREGERCRYPVRFYNPTYALFLCGVHIRAYLSRVPAYATAGEDSDDR